MDRPCCETSENYYIAFRITFTFACEEGSEKINTTDEKSGLLGVNLREGKSAICCVHEILERLRHTTHELKSFRVAALSLTSQNFF